MKLCHQLAKNCTQPEEICRRVIDVICIVAWRAADAIIDKSPRNNPIANASHISDRLQVRTKMMCTLLVVEFACSTIIITQCSKRRQHIQTSGNPTQYDDVNFYPFFNVANPCTEQKRLLKC